MQTATKKLFSNVKPKFIHKHRVCGLSRPMVYKYLRLVE